MCVCVCVCVYVLNSFHILVIVSLYLKDFSKNFTL